MVHLPVTALVTLQLVGLGFALLATVGCNKLSETECMGLRSEAFEIINEPHTCGDDNDCTGNAWPECPRPVSTKNNDRLEPLKAKFDKGECTEPAKECPDTPEIYCKQGLCVFRHRPGEDDVPTK